MRSILGMSVSLFVLGLGPLAHAQETKASIDYWHLWTGHDGKSHLTKCAMTSFAQQSANQQLQIKQPGHANLIFAYNPKGDWHENPKVQWVMPVQGSLFIEAQDGTKVTLAPGSLYLGEDLNTSPDAEGHKGHVSANKGQGPLVLLIAQLDASPTIEEPCHIK